ncbi:hypothetical protein C8J27_107121 [Rhodobacter aestuarii]|uniref:Uncharacterized protein n=1 Tax=Rhodobacter aestuarii TaxID=453582 RepID=A0A1N7NRT0_9RHOB|nr:MULTISPECIES: hypothetical protein [Rhodobacter]PTV94590.1 hypothetical protein C8J27_107121 [Rhodobacter aestuarii]SIT01000.1 hypothetical protein SAMN05421580_108106 [Rhodobacter aestuarii]SOC12605.1 hypothetical protein SAMN05877809_106120 [Rhodobacter sp. JA431]
MRPSLIALALCLAPLAATAEEVGPPLSADQFDQLTLGKTITYSSGGEVYGVEQYRPGRKVVWAFAEGQCEEGDWFAMNDQICFDYHSQQVGLQCWTFHQSGDALVAWFEGNREGAPLVSLEEVNTPLNCPGPEIGV